MFKSPFLFFSWSAKSKETPETFTGPSAFTIGGKGAQMLRVLMNDAGELEGFVDISTRKLSYAEVALLAPAPKMAPTATPAPGRVDKNKFEVLEPELELDDDEFPEKLKSDFHYRSNKKKSKKIKKVAK